MNDFEIRFAIKAPVQGSLESQYGESEVERVIRRANKGLLISRALVDVAAIRIVYPRFAALDDTVRILQGKGHNLSEAELRTIVGAVAKIKSSLPIGQHVERRSIEFRSEARAAGDRRIKFIVSDSRVVDRHGTRIETAGIDLTNYKRNPVFVWAHDAYGGWSGPPKMDSVIGKAVGFRQDTNVLELDVEFFEASVNPKSEQALRMIRAGGLQATSVGFIPREVKVEMKDGREVPVITKSELIECSLCSIPSNPNVGVSGGRARTA
jgi:HK97 family phage prohead protease